MSTERNRLCASGFHRWERELETNRGQSCVIRTCINCGVREVVWSPSGHHPRLKGPKEVKVAAPK